MTRRRTSASDAFDPASVGVLKARLLEAQEALNRERLAREHLKKENGVYWASSRSGPLRARNAAPPLTQKKRSCSLNEKHGGAADRSSDRHSKSAVPSRQPPMATHGNLQAAKAVRMPSQPLRSLTSPPKAALQQPGTRRTSLAGSHIASQPSACRTKASNQPASASASCTSSSLAHPAHCSAVSRGSSTQTAYGSLENALTTRRSGRLTLPHMARKSRGRAEALWDALANSPVSQAPSAVHDSCSSETAAQLSSQELANADDPHLPQAANGSGGSGSLTDCSRPQLPNAGSSPMLQVPAAAAAASEGSQAIPRGGSERNLGCKEASPAMLDTPELAADPHDLAVDGLQGRSSQRQHDALTLKQLSGQLSSPWQEPSAKDNLLPAQANYLSSVCSNDSSTSRADAAQNDDRAPVSACRVAHRHVTDDGLQSQAHALGPRSTAAIPRAKDIGKPSQATRDGGLLLEGSFDESGSALAFQQAVQAWRLQKHTEYTPSAKAANKAGLLASDMQGVHGQQNLVSATQQPSDAAELSVPSSAGSQLAGAAHQAAAGFDEQYAASSGGKSNAEIDHATDPAEYQSSSSNYQSAVRMSSKIEAASSVGYEAAGPAELGDTADRKPHHSIPAAGCLTHTQNNKSGLSGGSLLEGSFDEAAGAASFQEAVIAWRAQHDASCARQVDHASCGSSSQAACHQPQAAIACKRDLDVLAGQPQGQQTTMHSSSGVSGLQQNVTKPASSVTSLRKEHNGMVQPSQLRGPSQDQHLCQAWLHGLPRTMPDASAVHLASGSQLSAAAGNTASNTPLTHFERLMLQQAVAA
ncbi:hypothetical protein WJX74_002553 [Apatococcus lobatus]|uniref:Uncharacterized protein n=1 Tax=Apatococcus lobatus TaxID=904363 RepID=A0AAW1RBK7_9CHLO